MTTQELVALHFKIKSITLNTWYSINCPFHSDSNASAGIYFNDHKSGGVFKCQAGCGSLPLDKMIEQLNLDSNNLNEKSNSNVDIMDDWMREFLHIQNKEVSIKKQVVGYSNFLIEKKLSHEIITRFNGEYTSDVNDKLYG